MCIIYGKTYKNCSYELKLFKFCRVYASKYHKGVQKY